jgi:hypothetical protein
MATRGGARAKSTGSRAKPPSSPKRVPAASRDDAIAALRADIAALTRAVAAQTAALARAGAVAPPSADEASGLVGRLRDSADLLARSAAELPRADDFQPLADHLYAFAQSAPRLMESLEAVRAAVAPLEAAAGSLGEVAETLVATHHSWTESLMRLPRAEDYEPLTDPLREFARVSPILAETLGAVVKAVTPLPGLVEQVLGAVRTRESRGVSAGGDALRRPLEDAADRMASARETILDGLSTLPREPSYGKAAAQLRELATVSPSLMEWLRQLPEITLPLGEALGALDQAAKDLDLAERAARRALES